MRDELKAGIVVAVLILAIVVVFSKVLEKPQDVVPLYLVPAFFYAGYVGIRCSFKVWVTVTLAITLGLSVLYALP